MSKLSNDIKSWLIVWISFFVIALGSSLVYASISHVSSWATLSATKFNQMIDSVVPVWTIAPFNLSSCPSWWSVTDWTNWSPDLRWEFVRWFDNGRWVDTWRALASSQSGTSLPWLYIWYWTPSVWRADQPNNSTNAPSDYEWATQVTSLVRRINTSYTSTCCNWTQNSSIRVRPRNVALLYCIKN